MKLVVGLGNPGRKYEGTRHNVGFMVAAEVARRHGIGRPRQAFQGEVVEAELHNQKVLLLCPQTYMNLSGGSVLAARDFYKLAVEDVLIVCDDFALPLGKLRFRRGGSSGGQKGLADVLRRLGTDEVPRLRLGVGPVPERWDPADFVLGRFDKQQQAEAEQMIARAADGVADWVGQGIDYCMNQYN
jgi:PTH1 family peptidyl-tRNA hydrolase